ncbi:class I adenylate-forming enzyme family protein [Spirillospora sp. NPDC050679]
MNGDLMVDTAWTPPFDASRAADFLEGVVNATPPASGRHGPSLDDTMAALAGLGLPPGAAVAFALSNSAQTVRLYLSALLLGLVPLMVAPTTPSARVREIARRLDVRAVVAGRLDPARYQADRVHALGDAEAVLLDGPHAARTPYAAGQVLLSTSGTSGMTSACLHGLDALLRNAHRHARAVGMTGGDTVLVNLPLYYSYAMVAQVLAAYVTGARLVVSGPPFSVPDYRRALTDHGVTQSSITPTIARRLPVGGEGPPLPRGLRVLTVGGDQLPAAAVASLLAARPDGELYLTYGLTEAGPRVATLAAHAEPAHRHSSVGLPLPGVRTWLRQSDDEGCGELMVESDTVLLRKIGAAPAAGRALVRPGVVATGDVFRIDEDGYLHFRGRLSDFVMIRGEKVSLTGVRQAAQTLPQVTHCRPRVSVDPDGSTALDLEIAVTDPLPGVEEAVRRALNAMLLPVERPRRIVVTAADPLLFRK